jgi:hypothetical protein
MMKSDFYNAFHRHWNDAEYLLKDSRWGNASQLYAYSTECGLKCLMASFGMKLDPQTGIPPNQDRVHADEIWDRYEVYRTGAGAAHYSLPQDNPFAGWHISDRYANDANFNQCGAASYRKGAKAVKRLVIQALLDGRVVI